VNVEIMANILVTGGAGFIGSHLCEALVELGHKVVCVDNFNDYYDPSSKRRNISSLLGNPMFVLHELDICEKDKMSRVFENEQIQKVIHLAAMAGVRYSLKHPQLYFDVNVTGTLNILDLCVEYNISKIVFGSSSSVYGSNPHLPLKETDQMMPLNPYAYTKMLGEQLCKFYSDYRNLNIVCLRFFTVYGPRGRPDMAVFKFVDSIYKNKPIDVYGDGLLTRDFTFVLDTVKGIISSLSLESEDQYNQHTKAHLFEIINLGRGNNVTVNEMIAAMELWTGKKAIINMLPKNQGEADNTLADITKAQALLGFNPSISINEGVKLFVEWYNGTINNG
jgi:UDP-glucuronate 4-epimerase